jgi:hypothetical protein
MDHLDRRMGQQQRPGIGAWPAGSQPSPDIAVDRRSISAPDRDHNVEDGVHEANFIYITS